MSDEIEATQSNLSLNSTPTSKCDVQDSHFIQSFSLDSSENRFQTLRENAGMVSGLSNENVESTFSNISDNLEITSCPTTHVRNNDDPEQTAEKDNEERDATCDEVTRALNLRKQPLLELVSSEEGYVRRLRLVKDYYMPAVNAAATPGAGAEPSIGTSVPLPQNSIPRDPQLTPPTVPDDLAARWRIVWGNWIQLYEWHSAFLEKLGVLVETDPDRIPKLFIDSRARLRSIYSKYCENHRKAALIAEQYRDYFDELRVYIGDKEDVVSHLMQPVQRIMRYQLPIAEILKYTQRACSPELPMWKKTLDIMKEIPKDTQLILEAARIDGFPGVITALGNILLRSDLLVATTTREQLLETVTAYKITLQEITSGAHDPSCHTKPPLNPQATRFTSLVIPVTLNESPPENTITPSPSIAPTLTPQSSDISIPLSPAPLADASVLFSGNLKFIESRLFLFEQMLVVTEEVKPKRRIASNDSFAQSTYQFRAAINVNKMRHESHWYNCSLPSGHTNADAAAIDQLLCTGYAPDDLRFAILDQTPGRDAVYVIDPITSANREAWVVQLRDIQRMQHEFLLALQDPRRFNTGNRDETWSKDAAPHLLSTSVENSFSSLKNTTQLSVLPSSQTNNQNSQHRQRKWPSFTMKRSSRLGSSSSTSTNALTGLATIGQSVKDAGKSHPGIAPPHSVGISCDGQERPNCLARSLSAERRPLVRGKLDLDGSAGAGVSESGSSVNSSRPSVYRKSSQSANSSLKLMNLSPNPKSQGSTSPDDHQTKGGLTKKRNVFANLFSRSKPKHRSKHSNPHTTYTTDSVPPISDLGTDDIQESLDQRPSNDCEFVQMSPNEDNTACDSVEGGNDGTYDCGDTGDTGGYSYDGGCGGDDGCCATSDD